MTCVSSVGQGGGEPRLRDPFWGRTSHETSGKARPSKSARPLPRRPGPGPAYVITSEEMHLMGVMTVPEALRLVPGVLVRDSEMKAIVSIRGTGDFPYNNRVLFLLDGMPINSPDTGTFPGFPMDHLIPIEEIDRIEVYKGPGSAMFGPGAFQGTINIVPKYGALKHTRRGLTPALRTSSGRPGGDRLEQAKEPPGATKISFTCPMCEGDFKAMGACPECGMPLTEVKPSRGAGEKPEGTSGFDRPSNPASGGARPTGLLHPGGSPEGGEVMAPPTSDTSATTQIRYTCPMCGGDFKEMGACPECGMPLIKAKPQGGAGHRASGDKGPDDGDSAMGMLHLMASPEGEPMASLTYGGRTGDLLYSFTARSMIHKGDLEVQHEDFEHRITDLWVSAKKGPWSGIITYMETKSTPFTFAGGANAADERAFHARGGRDMMPHGERRDLEFDTLGTRERLLYMFGKCEGQLDDNTRVTIQASFQYRRGTTCAACHTGDGTLDPFSLSRVPWAGKRNRIKDAMQETFRSLGSLKIERHVDGPIEQDLTFTVDASVDRVDRDIVVTRNDVNKNQGNFGVAIEDRISLVEDRLWLTLAARWDYLSYADNEFSWHAGITASPLETLDLGLAFRTGFRPPTWDERNAAFVIMSEIPASIMGTKETGTVVQSERIKSVELNVNWELLPTLSLRLDAYYSQVSDFIDRTAPPKSYRSVPPPMIFTWGNSDETIDIRGFELGLEYVPSHRLWFSLGWAYQKTDTPAAPKGFVFGEWPYRGPPYAPENVVKFHAFAEPIDNLSMGLALRWFDERFVQFHMYSSPSIYHNWSDTVRAVQGRPLDSYFLADFSIKYRLPIRGAHVELGLLIQDLFNEKPFEYKHHPEDPSHKVGREFTFMLMWMVSV